MSFNFSQLVAFQKRLKQLDKKIQDEVCKNVVNGLASQLVKATKQKTPVGKYPKSSHKIGGTLRRGWKAKGFKIPNGYQATVFNDVSYAVFVEHGHRIVKKGQTVGFMPGHHMLEKSIDEIRRIADSYTRQKTEETIRRLLENWKIK